ncbi:MAG: DNA recombination protein RmuC [Acidobacteria bacterium]|nr:DNA recombination protein RmuC [Acidobacteriota bacterium]
MDAVFAVALFAAGLAAGGVSVFFLMRALHAGRLAAEQRDIDAARIAQTAGALVDPLRRAIEQLDRNRAESAGELRGQIAALAQAQRSLETQTSSLAQSLRSPSVRGRWGEVQLRRVVELAGMLPWCDFQEQPVAAGDGPRSRPDLIVRLPNERIVVVDAKAPLKAYLEAHEAREEAVRAARLQEHASQVKAHLNTLASRSYWSQFPQAPEFVVLFLPGEIFFSAALEQDPALIESGASQRVILATPTTLIALLKAVAHGWRQEQVAQNAREVGQLGAALYDRLARMTTHLESLRGSLRRTVDSYNDLVGSLESRVLVSARRMRDLGVAASRELPQPERIDTSLRVPGQQSLPLDD